MARNLSPEFITALRAPVIWPCLLLRSFFKSGELRLWTGVGILVHEGIAYLGAGDLLSISAIEETDEIKSVGVQVVISAIKTEAIALALLEVERGRRGDIHFGLLHESGNTLIPSPTLLFRGRLNTVEIRDATQNAQVVLGYENELIDLERPRTKRYTAAEQRRDFPGDSFLDYIAELVDKPLKWGSTE